MKEKSKLYGITGTLIFHGFILLCLFVFYFSSPAIQESGGVLVNFGNVDEAHGLFEPNNSNPEAVLPEPVEPISVPEPKVEQPIIAQESEKTVYIRDNKKKEEEKRKKEQEKLLQQERQRQQAEAAGKKREEQAKADKINNMAASAFGTGSGQGSQGSSASGQGNQGNPFGNSDKGSNTEVGGLGGSSYSLEGRSLGADGLPRPTSSNKEEGRIVVNITVDPKGNVIFAEVGGGTNISDPTMRKAAREAAGKAKFNSITSTNNQTGTITYRYSLK